MSKEFNATAIKAIVRLHSIKDADKHKIEKFESYMPHRTAGGKYVLKFGYGFDKSNHPIMGKRIVFSSFSKWILALRYCEEFIVEKANSQTDDLIFEEDILD